MNNRCFTIAISIIPIILFSSILESREIVVDCNGGGDYLTIQEGIDASGDGDTVLVAGGVYFENIDFLRKSIILSSIEGPDETVIDGEYNWDAIVTVYSTEEYITLLRGFTIQNGMFGVNIVRYTGAESPILSENIIKMTNIWGIEIAPEVSPIITNNVFEENKECIILCHLSSPIITNNVIYNNEGSVSIYFGDCSFEKRNINMNSANEIRNYTVYFVNNSLIENYGLFGNTITVDGVMQNGEVIIANNFICNNYGTAMYLAYSGEILLIQNTICNNELHGIENITNVDMVKNNTICGNGGFGLVGCNGLICFNNVWDNKLGDYKDCYPGTGDISDDPLFRNPANYDFHLTSDSPCIDAGNSTSVNFDIDMDHRPSGDYFDIGADEWIPPFDPQYRWFPID